MNTFRLRLNCIDHYQSVPSFLDPQPHFDPKASPNEKPKVPVLRVFGSTETGQKVCAHIHGAFPYLYVEYGGSLDPLQASEYMRRFHLSIDKALAVSYRRAAGSNDKFVAHISLVKGVPFYGYYVGYSYFLKIYLLNPRYKIRLADLLQGGSVMEQSFQTYETHIQYILQWMIDYNLFGCGYIDCETVKFRGPLPEESDLNSSMHIWHESSIPDELVLDETMFPKISHCSIEVDINVEHILNRCMIKERSLHHLFNESLLNVKIPPRLVPSMDSLWKSEEQRRLGQIIKGSNDSPFPAEALVSMSAESRKPGLDGWVNEKEYLAFIQEIIDKERSPNGSTPTASGLFSTNPLEPKVASALESIEELHGDLEMKPDLSTSFVAPGGASNHSSDVLINEKKIIRASQETENKEAFIRRVMRESQSKLKKASEQLMAQSFLSAEAELEESPEQSEPESERTEVDEYEHMPFDEPAEVGDLDIDIPMDFTSNPRKRKTKAAKSNDDLAGSPAKKVRADSGIERLSPKPRKYRFADGFESSPSVASELSEFSKFPQTQTSIGDHPSTNRERRTNGSQKTTPSSQESIKANSVNGTGSYSFPVRKHDTPHTKNSRQGARSSVRAEKLHSSPTLRQKSSGSKTNSKASGSSRENPPWVSQEIAGKVHAKFDVGKSSRTLLYGPAPPPSLPIEKMFADVLETKIYQEAYYSNDRDVPDRPREYAGREFRLKGTTVPYLPDFDAFKPLQRESSGVGFEQPIDNNTRKLRCTLRAWDFGRPPPSTAEVERWIEEEKRSAHGRGDGNTSKHRPVAGRASSQIDPLKSSKDETSPSSQFQTSVRHETQYMSLLSLEVHANTRGVLLPNPEFDEVQAAFWSIQSDEDMDNVPGGGVLRSGAVIVGPEAETSRLERLVKGELLKVETELDLINQLIVIVKQFDPDILTGYEIHNASWGYVIDRGRKHYEWNLVNEFARVKANAHGRFSKDEDKWGFNTTSALSVTGRHVINVWRAMRGELALQQYTLENVAFHLLQKRVPHYSHQDLTQWFSKGNNREYTRWYQYYMSRTQINLEILEKQEFVPRTSEQARLLGVDFFSVISRGSQFKVESLMFRIAKPENYILISPSKRQVGGQNALECLPMVMEPQSSFFTSPVLVLDFQSLYPSIMIAYNYCYSTFLGRVHSWRGRNKMGVAEYDRKSRLLELLGDQINVSPNGMMYVKPEIRKSLLARMLSEILETRVMVKSGMKRDLDDKQLQLLLNHRQLALKLMANVTYGYTSASFSGRMPCSEIADSIVQTARETLERTIALIHSVEKWGAEVVYGDTDSIFVLLKGRTKDEAFDIGNDIAKTVTDLNPRPVKLKFEKVYLPCVLLAKKRYVGYKYESPTQKEPEFEAKGIETVRRDGTPAEQKIEEACLNILFKTADLSKVKSYFQAQCTKIMKGKVSIQDFCFAKEVRLGTYSEKGLPPPGALISTRKMMDDPRAEPQYGERVPYIVITGAPGARLIDRCVDPEVMLKHDDWEIDSEYYISKNIIPPLERIFNLAGANVRSWYDEMPKVQRIRKAEPVRDAYGAKKTMESYMRSSSCLVCKDPLTSDSDEIICEPCWNNKEESILALQQRMNKQESRLSRMESVCRSCSNTAFGDEIGCTSRDCEVYYSRKKERALITSTRNTVMPLLNALTSKDDLLW